MAADRWEFWIDVGGTFTDCLAKPPGGAMRRLKLLSSGAFKGRIAPGSTRDSIIAPERHGDPSRFWIGWRLAVLGSAGKEIDRATVAGYDAATGRLALKGLSNDPVVGSAYELRCGEEAPVVAIRYLLGIPLADQVPPVVLRLGTTRGTNALITRTGARTALVATRGFGDVLEIGYQARPQLFDLTVRKPPTLTTSVVEIEERVTHDGHVVIGLQELIVRQQLQALFDGGIESLAICFLHADRHGAHEELVANLARDVGFREVSVSHAVAPLPKFVARADTTVVDAYLNPVLRDYVGRLRDALPDSDVRILTSAGGLVGAEHFCGKDSILSGPAGGVVGFSRVAEAAGYTRAIGFDMGGTSTDVSRYDGRLDLEYETEKAGVRLVAPTMAIETVAAGGGSICRYDGVKFVVGPQSAGADPGPACYGRGGPLTITDVNFFLGRIVPERFPFPLDIDATKRRLEELAAATPSPSRMAVDDLAAGLLRIANANMAAAIRSVTIAKGANPADYVLVSFGGAAPQHACAVARELGIRQVLNHRESGVLSALGIGLANVVRHRSQGVERLLDGAAIQAVREVLDELEEAARAEVVGEGVPVDRITAARSLDIRYRGTDSYLTISWPADDDFAAAFALLQRKRYGYVHGNRPLEIVAARVEVTGCVGDELPRSERVAPRVPTDGRTVIAYFDGTRRSVPVFERSSLGAGDRIVGPAIITEEISTTIIEADWRADVMSGGEILLTELKQREQVGIDGPFPTGSAHAISSADPVALEIFNNLLAGIATQMGVTLRNTASSVNVKERLDFSCAVFTADGRLVANAPHVPVHLGAMEETVRQTIATNPDLQPGDVIATNDPYAGGSHLPDVTVVTPVFGPSPVTGEGNESELLFFTANRAHHAEIGGMAPGSMPPLSENLAEEGVLIQNLKIVAAGQSRFDELRDVLRSGPFPSRDVETNLADVTAQVAANRQGASDLLALVERLTWPVVCAYMDHLQEAAEKKVRLALRKLPVGTHSFTDYLETADGMSVPISVNFTLHGADHTPAATLDFTGTGPAVAGNLNANRAIVTAAVIYTLRLLVDEDIPLNHGVLRPIEIDLPHCLLNPDPGPTPETTPAVAGGNVETSQRVVDVLLGALGIAAASQGTMNNVIFGDESFGYYETICGGVFDSPGQWRRWPTLRWRRRAAANRVLAATHTVTAHSATRSEPAVWCRGWRAWHTRQELATPRGWHCGRTEGHCPSECERR
jgi:5-oxoprolinase (ATP-hydrolysing)